MATRTTANTTAARPGYWKLRRRLSTDVRRHAKSGPTPVRSSRKSPMGTMSRLYQSTSSEILSPETASEITGNSVPQSTAKQLARRIRLLNKKLDSREMTLSNSDSLFRYSRRSRISQTVAATPTAINVTKYFPISDRANACTDCTMPERVRNVPRIHRKNVAETSTMFHTFIMPFFSCIITECRNAVPLSQEHTSELQSQSNLVCRL